MALVKHNNNSISSITTPGSLAQGKMTLISSQTASGSASIEFTSGIDSTYPIYRFEFISIHPQNDASIFLFQGDTGTNTNYNQTITSTNFYARHDQTGAVGEISYDGGSTFVTVSTTVGGSGLENIVEDTTPQLGGDLDINGFNITSANTNQDINIIPSGTGNVVVDSGIRLNDQVGAPSAVTNTTIVYAAATTGGGTGVHFVDGSTTGEMVSKTKAIVFGLIF